MAEETKHDLFLKRAQIIVAIIGGICAAVLGVYNVKKNIFSKPEPAAVQAPAPAAPSQPQPARRGEKIESALEEVGASWLQSLKKSDSADKSAS